MSDALFEALGIDEKDTIDSTEVEHIQRVVKAIRLEAALIAKDNDTDDTIAMLDALLLKVKAYRRDVSPQDARKIVISRNSGEMVSFTNGTVDPEVAKKAAAHDDMVKTLEEKQAELDKLQALATGTAAPAPKALGGGVDVDDLRLQFEQVLTTSPDAAANLLKALNALVSVTDTAERRARAVVVNEVATGTGDFRLVLDSSSGTWMPHLLSEAYTQNRTTTQELTNAQRALDPKVTGSVAEKAAWYDYNVDESKADGWAGLVKKAKADLATAEKERDDAVKVRTPMENVINSIDGALDKVLATLNDGFLIKTPKAVSTAKVQIAKVQKDLRDSAKPASK